MRSLLLACTGALLMAGAAGAIADDAGIVRTHNLEVKERLQHLELINVTSEKPTNPQAEPLDDELLAILEEALELDGDEALEDR
ncbi:MAG: hypothetical protein ACNA7W_01265 [Pseudomonadales bacterium]